MRIKIPEFSDKKELHRYLIAHKNELIADKKSLPIKADVIAFGAIEAETGIAKKALAEGTTIAPDSIVVDVIANLAMWCDSYNDVMITDSWKKSIQEKGDRIPFLKDHNWSIDGKIAKTLEVYAMDVDTKKLGVKSAIKQAQALIFKAELNPEIDRRLYNMYKQGLVDQHSIGLRYLQIELAINDPDEKACYKVWEKYIDQIVNREKPEKDGYFWAVKEAMIMENSAVLFGANSMTPTLSVETAESLQSEEAGKSTSDKKAADKMSWDHLSKIKY